MTPRFYDYRDPACPYSNTFTPEDDDERYWLEADRLTDAMLEREHER